MTTRPGFSSRSTLSHTQQFPLRDEAAMNSTDEAGWSNSDPAEDVAKDVYPDVAEPHHPEPGFSNGMSVVAVEGQVVKAEATSKQPQAKADDESPAKKAAAKKTAAKKKG